jgi:hypothetical protein
MYQAMRGDETNDQKDNEEGQANPEPDAVLER